MGCNLINRIYELLSEFIDGPLADEFLKHVISIVPDVDAVPNIYGDTTQTRWMIYYWISQLSTGNPNCFNDNHLNLMACRNANEFIAVFKAIIIPCLEQSDFHIRVNVPTMSMDYFQQTVIQENSYGG